MRLNFNNFMLNLKENTSLIFIRLYFNNFKLNPKAKSLNQLTILLN